MTVPPTETSGFSNPFDRRIPPFGLLAPIDVGHGLSFAVHGVPDLAQEPVWQPVAWARSHVRLRRSPPSHR